MGEGLGSRPNKRFMGEEDPLEEDDIYLKGNKV